MARFLGAGLAALGGGGGVSASFFSRNARSRAVLASRCLASVSRMERATLFVMLALESCLEGVGAKMPRASIVFAIRVSCNKKAGRVCPTSHQHCSPRQYIRGR